MFRKICNYAAILSLSLVFTGSAVFANYPLPNKNKTKSVKVAENKKFSFFNTIISNGENHSYSVKVESGKTSTIFIRTPVGVNVKVKTPTGETKTYSQNKFFEIKLHNEGTYEIEVEANSISRYSMEVFNK